MIDFKIKIKNIFKKPSGDYFSSKNWNHSLPYDRSIDLDYGKINDTIVTIDVSTEFTGHDHAGPSIELSIFGYGFILSIPKGRHWNYRNNCWLENYNVYMDKVIKLAKEKYQDKELYDYNFQKYYEEGDSPEEALENYSNDISNDDLNANVGLKK